MTERYRVVLSEVERTHLQVLTSKGKTATSQVINALILLNCDQSAPAGPCRSSREIAQMLDIGERKIERVKKRCVEEGVEAALVRKRPEREYARKIDGELEARLIAMSCSQLPEGHARWTLRLLAERSVELSYVESLSHETVHRVLKEANSSLGARLAG
ncbi:helix-turn-helix domain-containing protein [Azorhizophilus paspali]|uniref:Helix-turn-helix domain-containing protein n=1 Tax=Azorhizophilus paspali TaxID=69963 RepID=A0ABV6SNH9_AZOPA